MLNKIGFKEEHNENIYSYGFVGFSTLIDFDTKELIDTYDDDMLNYLISIGYVKGETQ